MYRIFGRNLNNFFRLTNDGNPDLEYRLRIAKVLIGLADYALYKSWENENPETYDEINNLIYEIERNADQYHAFKTFASDLWGYGYYAIKDNRFSPEIVEEQLKIINLCLGTQYWVDLALL